MDNELNSFYKTEQVLSNAQKKKLKKKQKEYQEQLELDDHINNKIKVGEDEYKLLEDKLFDLGFKIYNIQPDGNCLFKSIEHQLNYYKDNGFNNVTNYDYKELRKLAVDYLLSNMNQYKFFISSNSNNETNNSELDETDNRYLNYCQNMLNDGEWGSELEIIALTNVLNYNITVYNLNNNEIKYGNNNNCNIVLNISYHKYQYILGEHYNSLIPI